MNLSINSLVVRVIGVALIGGLAAYLAFGPGAAHGLQILALLLGWASYGRFGGKLDGFKKSLLHSLVGGALGLVAVAFAAQHAAFGHGLDFPIWIALGVAITLALLAAATKLSLLSDFPALLLGYAAIAGSAKSAALEAFLLPSTENPALGVFVSLLIGAFLACGADLAADGLEKLTARSGATRPAAGA